jgi:hypothetical protein
MRQSLSYRFRFFFACLVPLDVDVTGNITAKTFVPWRQKRGDLKKIGFLSSNFMKLCRNIHRSVWQLLGGFKKSKWQPLPW